MADKKDEKKKDNKKKEPKKHSKGGISFEAEIILFVVGLFILWLLMGKPTTENTDKPFIKQQTVSTQ